MMYNTYMNRIDFYFVLAMIAIAGASSSLFLQFREAQYEGELLNSQLAPLVRIQRNPSLNDIGSINRELIDLELQLEALDLED